VIVLMRLYGYFRRRGGGIKGSMRQAWHVYRNGF
jgi:hypothetical protein